MLTWHHHKCVNKFQLKNGLKFHNYDIEKIK